MEYTVMTNWFKTTIPGIIILGAIGSIIAAFAIWLLHRLFLPIFVRFLYGTAKKVLVHFAGPAAKQITRFVLKHGNEKLSVFYTLQTMKLLLSLFVAVCGFLFFALRVTQSDDNLVRISVLTPLVISFLALWYGLKSVTVVMLPVYFDIENTIEKAKEEAVAEKGKQKGRLTK